MIWSIAVSVLCPGLNPDWQLANILKSSIWRLSCFWTHFSKGLASSGILVTWRKLLGSEQSPLSFLMIGETWPVFKQSGMEPWDEEALMILVQSGTMLCFTWSIFFYGNGSLKWLFGLSSASTFAVFNSSTNRNSSLTVPFLGLLGSFVGCRLHSWVQFLTKWFCW